LSPGWVWSSKKTFFSQTWIATLTFHCSVLIGQQHMWRWTGFNMGVDLVSISSTFYTKLYTLAHPKSAKNIVKPLVLFALLGSLRVKANRKMLVKSTSDRNVRQLESLTQAKPQLDGDERARGSSLQSQETSHLISRHSLFT